MAESSKVIQIPQESFASSLNDSTLKIATSSLTCLGYSMHEWMPFSLIGRESQEKIKTFADLWPSDFEIFVSGFECSLQEGKAWGDFHMKVDASPEELSKLQQAIPFEEDSWRRLSSLLDNWSQSDCLARFGVKAIVLEFDIGSNSEWPPKPNLFLVTEKKEDLLELLKETFFFLYQEPREKLCSTFLQFTKKATSFSVGFMLARSDCFRVTIETDFVGLESLDSLLPQSNLEKTFESLQKIEDGGKSLGIYPLKLGININSQGAVDSKVGIYTNQSKNGNRDFFVPILDRLVTEKLISQEKKSAFLSFGGLHAEPFFDLPSDFWRLFCREVHHLKFVCAPNQALGVKAYLSLQSFAAHNTSSLVRSFLQSSKKNYSETPK